jgi:histidine ammonia-lyase
LKVLLNRRSDITLDVYEKVAWGGDSVSIGPDATSAMDRAHAAFTRMVTEQLAADPDAQIYSITFGPGDAGAVDLEHDTRPTILWTGASFGEALPERVVRGIVLARLANFLGGHTASRSEVALGVASMLDPGKSLPRVPVEGTGGAGEILPLGHVFHDLSTHIALEPKERMALINGSPCAAALVADVALAARRRVALAEKVFALSVEALGSQLEAYSADNEELWGDEHETAALRSLRSLLEGHRPERMARQSPVSHRILARVLGQARRAQAEGERAARVSLACVTDNPVYIPPDTERPLGAVFSTGGYHNTQAPAAMDAIAFQWADLCMLAERHTDRLFQHPVTAPLLESEFTYRSLHMVQDGWAEQARSLAQPSLIALGSWGQNDVPSASFPAWRKADAIGRCHDASLAILAVLCVHVLASRGFSVPPRLTSLVEEVNRWVPPITEARLVGPELEALSHAFTRQITQASQDLVAQTAHAPTN